MPKFEIRQERKSMDGADPPVYLEKQVCNGLSGQDITNYELGYNVISRLLQSSTSRNVVKNHVIKSPWHAGKSQSTLPGS